LATGTVRRSVSGIAFLLAGAVVAYKTRVQPTVSTSSTEAEFVAPPTPPSRWLYIYHTFYTR
jgi:hypothetical protein